MGRVLRFIGVFGAVLALIALALWTPRHSFEVRVLAAQNPASGTAQTPAQTDPQSPQTAPQQPSFRTGINFVRVDVIVTDQGRQSGQRLEAW